VPMSAASDAKEKLARERRAKQKAVEERRKQGETDENISDA
jgi:hypothetical protein